MNLSRDVRYEMPAADDKPIWDIWLSVHRLPAMAVADELGVFSALDSQPGTAAEVARSLGFNGRATHVLLSMLAALDLCVVRDGRYELSALARTYLVPQSQYYWGPLLRALGVVPKQRESLIRALRAQDEAGTIAPVQVPSKAWESGQMDSAQAEMVSRIMHCHSLPACIGAARSGCFEGVSRLLDVGGGSGCFSIATAQRYPDMHCSVMELPAVCDVARRYIAEGGVSDRVDTCAVNMFHDTWPTGYDGILFSNVFHDWGPETNLFLARRAHEVLPSGGRIFLHEMLLADDGSGPATTASFSMLMLFGTRGRQYSLPELRQVLGDAGFVDIESRASHGYYSIVSGCKR
jgi:hypothetical protein